MLTLIRVIINPAKESYACQLWRLLCQNISMNTRIIWIVPTITDIGLNSSYSSNELNSIVHPYEISIKSIVSNIYDIIEKLWEQN